LRKVLDPYLPKQLRKLKRNLTRKTRSQIKSKRRSQRVRRRKVTKRRKRKAREWRQGAEVEVEAGKIVQFDIKESRTSSHLIKPKLYNILKYDF
jgi:hypothetical protein